LSCSISALRGYDQAGIADGQLLTDAEADREAAAEFTDDAEFTDGEAL
jgi:hypothetical protein